MSTDLANRALKPIEFLQNLNEDYITDYIHDHGDFPPQEILNSLTSKWHITSYVRIYVQQQNRDTLREQLAAMNAWRPLFLAVPPGQATGHKLTASPPVKKTEAPLRGVPLLDGKATAWNIRLQEKSSSYNSETSSPLIFNYHEARQIRAEYASLEFRMVPPHRRFEFRNGIEQQRQLVGKLYDAIMNMEDILEEKKPISFKNTVSTDESNSKTLDITAGKGATRAITQGKKRTFSELACGIELEKPHQESQRLCEEGLHDHVLAAKGPQKTKESISVIKVKSLSRIEVEMLCWEILYTIRDVDRGQLPFLSWSGRDWGWDAQFSTFRDRFEAVATTLRRSKAAVCSLLESDYMARLAAHPRRELRRKQNNRSQNAERNAQVFIGRHAIGTGQVQVGATGDLQDRDGNVVAAAGAFHDNLIEQTRKLGQLSQQEPTAKKARLAPNAADAAASAEAPKPTSAELARGTGHSDASKVQEPVVRKPRKLKPKPASKVLAAISGNGKNVSNKAVVMGAKSDIQLVPAVNTTAPLGSSMVAVKVSPDSPVSYLEPVTSNSKSSSDDGTLGDMPTLSPEAVAEQSADSAMSISWDTDDQWNAVQQPARYFDPTAPSIGLDLGLDMDMDMAWEHCMSSPSLWLTQSEDEFGNLFGDSSSTKNNDDDLW
ncbi:hypothetical protein SEPCBS119000_001645 [Sporothrix epigloea]|uniref:Uncharacterized protein n=1 Tax=Sporothrix epigloea TaxID=1892477 RepID=A0ABP0DBU5_9PEZI